MVSGALILGSGAYAWWAHGAQPVGDAPILTKKTAPAPAKVAALPPPVAPPPLPSQQPESSVAPPPQAAPAAVEPQSPPAEAPVAQQDASAAPPPAIVAANVPSPAMADAPPPTPPQPAGRYADGYFIGQSTDTAWGTVQVAVSVRDGAIAQVEPIDYPSHRRRSIQINGWALPILAREVIQAQSADVDIVSQATTTSVGYLQSLTTALVKAKPAQAEK